MNIGGITFRHETKNIEINIGINVAFKCDVFAFSRHLVQCNFDLYNSQISRGIHKKNSIYRGGCERDRSTRYFLVENLREDAPQGIGTRVEKVDNQPGKSGMSEVIRMSLSNIGSYSMLWACAHLFINSVLQKVSTLQECFGNVSVDRTSVLRVPFVAFSDVCTRLLLESRSPVAEVLPKLEYNN